MSTKHPRSVDPDADDELESAASFGESVPAMLTGLDEWQGRGHEPVFSGRELVWGLVIAAASVIGGCVTGLPHRGG